MTCQRLYTFAAFCVLVGLMMSSSGQAQSNLNIRRAARLRSQPTAKLDTLNSPATSYAYTLFDFPGSLSTFAAGTVVSGKSSKIEVVGCYNAVDAETSFLMHYTAGKKATAESYQKIVVPGSANDDCANGVNKDGTIVGLYVDASGIYHGWQLTGATFSTINVPFQGAVDTVPNAINDSGEIVGNWDGGNTTGAGFTLINGTYTSILYPGTSFTDVWTVNSKGDLGGDYYDANNVLHGMTDIAGVFSTLDPPGSIYTFIQGLDDHDNAVGWFCTTTECEHYGNPGEQGFLYSGGNFTIFNYPGAVATYLLGINNAGVLLGIYTDAAGNDHGFLATP